MLSVEQAAASILHRLSSLSAIKKPLDESLGFFLSDAIAAERDYPPFNRITHDGMAIAYAAYAGGKRDFLLEDYAAAGEKPHRLSHPDQAFEVATGAPLPEGCDTVIPYESFSKNARLATLLPGSAVGKGDAIHAKGADLRQGKVMLQAGQKIGVPEMAMLAANGVAYVPVHAKPSIGLLATGDELVEVEKAIEPYQIRRSNDRTLNAALRLNGFADVAVDAAKDDEKQITAKLEALLACKDIVLITGGVSKGARDYVPAVLSALGAQAEFHRVAQKPGKPLWFGRKGATLIFGLPGNPNSALVCLIRYVIPALYALSGAKASAPRHVMLAHEAAADAALTLFTPVRLQSDGAACPMTTRTSGDFTGLLGSDGFIELPGKSEPYTAGSRVDFYPWSM